MIKKYSQGQMIPEPSQDLQKEAAKTWTPEDEEELEQEGRSQR